MARINLIICDLCKKPNNSELYLSLQDGRGKNKKVVKAEICQLCFEKLTNDINREYSLEPQKRLGEGETIIPSKAENIVKNPRPKCYHDNNSYEPPYFICKDCGEKWTS